MSSFLQRAGSAGLRLEQLDRVLDCGLVRGARLPELELFWTCRRLVDGLCAKRLRLVLVQHADIESFNFETLNVIRGLRRGHLYVEVRVDQWQLFCAVLL